MNEITENGDKEEELPEEAVPVENQVAGHRFGYCLNKVALLRHSKTTDILKPICDKRSEREFRFYSTVWNSDNNNDLIIAQLRSFLAQYNGIFTNVKNGKNFIRLKDLTIDFNEPSILDVKIGPKTYDPEANQTKIISEINKYQFAQQIGFRILGMRVTIDSFLFNFFFYFFYLVIVSVLNTVSNYLIVSYLTQRSLINTTSLIIDY